MYDRLLSSLLLLFFFLFFVLRQFPTHFLGKHFPAKIIYKRSTNVFLHFERRDFFNMSIAFY